MVEEELPDRVKRAEEARHFRELLDASSLGSPGAKRIIARGEREMAARLTGMPDEQAEWEGESDTCRYIDKPCHVCRHRACSNCPDCSPEVPEWTLS